MTTPPMKEITSLLHAWRGGDQSAFEKLVPLVHDELHRLAHIYMTRERAGHILQTTALVNEAYLRLVDTNQVEWRDRAHFFAISANLMRRILIDFARSFGYQKRGGDVKKVSFSKDLSASNIPDPDLVKLDDALNDLARFDSRKEKVVELKFFGGLDLDETAEVLKVSRETVKRDWRMAKVWLLRELKNRGADGA